MKTKIHAYYYLGGLIGLVLGYLIAKVYQIWVVVYLERDSRIEIFPLFWNVIYNKPALFTFWVVLVFIVICTVFVRISLSTSLKKID